MELLFDTRDNPKQKQCAKYWCDDTTLDVVFGGSKNCGKSYLGASLIFGDAFIYPGTHYFIARKELNDLRKYTRPTIHEVFDNWGINNKMWNFNGQDNMYELYNGSKVFFIPLKYLPSDPNYQRYGSMNMTRGWLEESGEVETVDAKNNLLASCGRWKNDDYKIKAKLLQTCNPSKNYLYPDYYKPNKEGTLQEHLKFIQAFPQDNKTMTQEYYDMLYKTLSVNQRERLLFGNWEFDDNENVLMDYEAIVDLFTNHVDGGEKYITCDIARKGKDNTTVFTWEGLKCIDVKSYERTLVNEVIDILESERKKHSIRKSNVICDEDGVGGGVVDVGRYKGFQNGSTKDVTGNYLNLKSQCTYKLADMVNEGLMSIVDNEYKEKIIKELEVVEGVDMSNDGKKKIINRERMIQILGYSPDFYSGLLMRMYPLIKPKVKAVVRRIR